MPPGADDVTEDEDETEEMDDEEEDEDEEMGEGGYGFEEDYVEEDDDFMQVFPGGHDWFIVFGAPVGGPARARGAVPERQPGDEEITTGVWAREQPDRRHIVYGAALANCLKLLSRIFKMQQQAGQLAWRSELALTATEWGYLKAVLAHDRLRPLLQQGRRALAPLPDYGFPQRFRPVDESGQALAGPRVSRKGKPWNMGRQFFSSWKDGDDSSFVWADGVKAMEPEAQQSFAEAMF